MSNYLKSLPISFLSLLAWTLLEAFFTAPTNSFSVSDVKGYHKCIHTESPQEKAQ